MREDRLAAQPAFHDVGPEMPNGSRLGGRLDDFVGVLGEPLRSLPQARGEAHFFHVPTQRGDADLVVLCDGLRAVHLEWRVRSPRRSAIISRLEMLERWPEDATPEGPFSLRNYESTMGRARSERLAHALAADWFLDANGDPVAPGTFTCVVTRSGWTLSAGGRVLSVAQ
ncbi:MAG TPA: hypothetical protein VFA70_13035 [Dehalococcoidia bacterium]|nr:hypothetical protein [Dehalococcoidia bacterium]